MLGNPVSRLRKPTNLPEDLNYDLLAIDLDGTLLDREHRLPPANRAALHEAHEAGLRIALCTGRSFTETRPILDQIGLDLDVTITVGGALISDAATGRTLESTSIPRALADEVTAWFREQGYSVLWLRDASVVGFDGYLLQAERCHPQIERWFALTPCEMRMLDAVPADDPTPPLRVTVVDDCAILERISVAFRERFDGRMAHNIIDVPTYDFTVIEAFDASVDKWTGICRLCRRWDIDPRRTVAIGDDVNDLPMIRHAGLGVAIGNAKPALHAVARHRVASNVDAGVAELIGQVLANEI